LHDSIGLKRKVTNINNLKTNKLTPGIRRQLTLFVSPDDAKAIEKVRQEFNPLQFELIKAHVTLCREDEIERLEQVVSNLIKLTKTKKKLSIEFDKVARFDNGKGLFLPATKENNEFDTLRKQVLSRIIDYPRKQEAHITLMHPRNSTCTDEVFTQVERMRLPTKLSFGTISLIEQKDGGKWKVLQEFSME
jgi:hypothetical protein